MSDKEIVICAAILMSDGYIVRGHRHHDCIRTAREIPRYKADPMLDRYQGFVTSRNRYVTRLEGKKLQVAAGVPPFRGKYGVSLFSEDLY